MHAAISKHSCLPFNFIPFSFTQAIEGHTIFYSLAIFVHVIFIIFVLYTSPKPAKGKLHNDKLHVSYFVKLVSVLVKCEVRTNFVLSKIEILEKSVTSECKYNRVIVYLGTIIIAKSKPAIVWLSTTSTQGNCTVNRLQI